MLAGATVNGGIVSVPEVRAQLARIAEEMREHASESRDAAEAREWARMAGVHRTLAHVVAGIDGDIEALADRPWRAIPDPEREALREGMRGLMLAYRGFVAVRGLPRACA